MTEAPFILSRGDLRAEIDPGYGGRVTGFWSETLAGRVDWITPSPKDSRDVDNPAKAGLFPLVPFSNRIRNGCFTFADQNYILEATEVGNLVAELRGVHWFAGWLLFGSGYGYLKVFDCGLRIWVSNIGRRLFAIQRAKESGYGDAK